MHRLWTFQLLNRGGATCKVSAQIVELLNIVYCLAELTEFAAFIHLRRKAPHLRRPFRIGLNTWGCALMLTPATALLIALIAQPLLDVDWMVSLHPFTCHLL